MMNDYEFDFKSKTSHDNIQSLTRSHFLFQYANIQWPLKEVLVMLNVDFFLEGG